MPKEIFPNNVTLKQEGKIPEDFRDKGQNLLRSLKVLSKEIEGGKNFIQTYGEMIEKTSGGKELLISNLLYNFEPGVFPRDSLVLIAKDLQSNKIVGLRIQEIDRITYKDGNKSKYPIVNVEGGIITSQRGEGIASSLDNALLKTLHNIINEIQKNSPENEHQINWSVSNDNLNELEELKKLLTEAKEKRRWETVEKVEKQIALKKQEQERWQSLYGKDGKMKMVSFGISPSGEKQYERIIKPDEIHDENVKMYLTAEQLKQLLRELEDSIN